MPDFSPLSTARRLVTGGGGQKPAFLGRFELQRVLGQGAQATVWLAQGCFDMRKLLAIHAHGLARAAALPTQPHQAEAGADPNAGAGSGQGGGGVGLGLGAGDGGGSGEVDPDVAERERLCRQRARTLLAEILLMQHSCHWFCKSKTVASARLMARQRTSHEQVVASVTPETRSAYALLVGLPK